MADIHLEEDYHLATFRHNQAQNSSSEPIDKSLRITLTTTNITDDRIRKHRISKPLKKRPLKKLKTNRCSPLVRVIETSPPTLVYTKPEDFMNVVQKLTGLQSSCSSSSSSFRQSKCSQIPISSIKSEDYSSPPVNTSHVLMNIDEQPLQTAKAAFSVEEAEKDGSNLLKEHYNRHDSAADEDEVSATSVSCDLASSCASFSISDCFEALESLPEHFEAHSISSEMDGPQSCSFYTVCDNAEVNQWDLDALDDILAAGDTIDETSLLQASATTYPTSLQSYCLNQLQTDSAPPYITEMTTVS